jgi:hypothetical protein
MQNQHREIIGHRELNEFEIACMNDVKELAVKVGELITALDQMEETDKRWIAIAQTDLQKGFMSLTRAIAQPTTF